MKKLLFPALTFAALSLAFSACGGATGSGESVDTITIQGVDSIEGWADADSTIYGHADGFGQSGMTLIADDGTEYELSLTQEASDGTLRYAQIFGDRNDTARYALTLADDAESVSIAINLTQVSQFTKRYEIRNAHLVLTTDSMKEVVRIETLNADTLSAVGVASGRTYTFAK